jgi:hypothetical protein
MAEYRALISPFLENVIDDKQDRLAIIEFLVRKEMADLRRWTQSQMDLDALLPTLNRAAEEVPFSS